MQFAIIALFATIAAGLAVVLIPGLEQRISADIADINKSFVSGVTGPVINAWVEVSVIGAGLGLLIWLLEYKIGRKIGQEVPLPPVQSIGVPAAPTFGTSTGFRAGPFQSGVTASTGQAPPQVFSTPVIEQPAEGGGGGRGGRRRGSLRATVNR